MKPVLTNSWRKTLSSDICKLAYVYGRRWTVKKLKEEIFNVKMNGIRGKIQCIFKKLTLAFHQVQSWSFLKPQRGAWGKRFNPPRQWVFTRCPFRHSYARISYVYDSTVALVNVWFLYPRAFYFWVTLLRYDRNISHLKLIMHILLLLRKQREYMHCEQRFADRSLNF